MAPVPIIKESKTSRALVFSIIFLCSAMLLYFNFAGNNREDTRKKEAKKENTEAEQTEEAKGTGKTAGAEDAKENKEKKDGQYSAIFLNDMFMDTFAENKILEETGDMAESANPYWWVNSGAFLIYENGIGRTVFGALEKDSKWQIRYKNGKEDIPEETDGGYYPQNIFRLITKSKWRDFRQEAYFKIAEYNLSQSKNRGESNGLLLFSRYKDQYNLYYAGIRVDGTAVIKKKINKEYYTMAQEKIFAGEYNRNISFNLLPKNAWIGIRSEIKAISDNQAEIKLFIDKNKTGDWKLAAKAVDDGESYGGEAILSEEYAGIRTDFMDAEFDDYKIIGL